MPTFGGFGGGGGIPKGTQVLYTFTGSGSMSPPPGATTVDMLIVGGGGTGGGRTGGTPYTGGVGGAGGHHHQHGGWPVRATDGTRQGIRRGHHQADRAGSGTCHHREVNFPFVRGLV